MNQLFKRTKGDQVIWGVVIILSCISVLTVFSATRSLEYKYGQNTGYYMIKQLFFLALGFVIMYMVHKVNYNKFARLTIVLYMISIPLLIYTLFFGVSLNQGSRWVYLPGTHIGIQSSDLAKLALFMFLARMLSMKQAVIKDLKKGFIPVLIPVLLTCALIAPANMSTALMLGFTCSILFFIGRVKITHLFLLVLIGIMGIVGIYAISKVTGFGRASTWEQRIVDFTGSDEEKGKKKEDVFQVQQAKIAIAYGGVLGRGPGNSLQRNVLPHIYSDFIYALIIEEYGIVGGMVVMFLYLLFLWRSILIFKRCPFAFGAFLAVGLSITLVFQAMLNMAVNVHLVPVTGLTLPLVSMGGSSILFTSVAIGVILSVSRYVDEMEGKKKAEAAVAVAEPKQKKK
jgi:cell division protein FtsW